MMVTQMMTSSISRDADAKKVLPRPNKKIGLCLLLCLFVCLFVCLFIEGDGRVCLFVCFND